MSNKLKRRLDPSNNKIKNNSVKISQCMIVKNEERNIKKALSWAKDIVFEQIVVDTGSTDRTVEIAKEMGAKVYHFEWINDFAAAKNYAIEQATGDWIAFLDADEYLDKKDTNLLVSVINKIETDKTQINSSIGIIRTKLVNIEEDGKIISTHFQDRVFRNIPAIRYHGKIHEQIDVADGQYFGCLKFNTITIIHTGYQQNVRAYKGKRNAELLEKEVVEHPDDYDKLSYFADSLSAMGDNEKAYALHCKCIDNIEKMKKNNRRYCSFLLIMKMLSGNESNFQGNILETYNLFDTYYPTTPDSDYFIGIYYYVTKDLEHSIKSMNAALEKFEAFNTETIGIKSYCKLDDIHRYLGYSHYQRYEYDFALSHLIIYQKANKEDNDSLMKILFIIQQEPLAETDKINFMLKILSALYDLTALKDVLICQKAAKILGLQTLYAALSSNLSQSDKDWLENS